MKVLGGAACVLGSLVLVACPDRHIGSPRCGDGLSQDSEECDGADLKNSTCASLGFDSGSLACAADCRLDTSGCIPVGPCGDGVAQAAEECDGTDLKGAFCMALGWDAGYLLCSDECQYATHFCCREGSCGNALIDCVEECDYDYVSMTPVLGGATCEVLGFDGGILNCSDCVFGTYACCNNGPCGDGEINCGEDCETLAGATFLEGETCETLGFAGGTLGCSACAFDTSACF